MAIFRTKHNKANPYVMMNKGFLEDPKLSAKAKGVLAYLLSRPDNWQTDTDQIISVMKDGRESILSGLKELEKAGYFTRTPYRDPATGKILKWIKDVYEVPLSQDGFNDSENPETLENTAINGFSSDGKSSKSRGAKVSKSERIAETLENTAINGFSISGKPDYGKPDYGNPDYGNPDDGKPYDGKPDCIINKDEITIESINIDSIKTECNKPDTHTQNGSRPTERIDPDAVKAEVVDPEVCDPPRQDHKSSQPDRKSNSYLEDLDREGACDNKSRRTRKSLVSEARLDELEEIFESGGSLGTKADEVDQAVSVAELQGLGDRILPDQVALYRKSKRLLYGRLNDLEPAFIKFCAWKYWNNPGELKRATDLILSHERSTTKWQALVIMIEDWQESIKNPESMVKYASDRASRKNASQFDRDVQLAGVTEAIKLKQSSQEYQQAAARRQQKREREMATLRARLGR